MAKKLYLSPKFSFGMGLTMITLSLLSGCSSQRASSPASVGDANNLFGRNGSGHSHSTTTTTHAIKPSADEFTGELSAGPHQGLLGTRRIYFAFDSYKINPKYLPAIQAHANYLKSHPTAQVLVEGNTDSRGSRNYNLALGQKRANAVAKQLRIDGVSAAQVHTISYGKERPIALGNKPEDFAKNRRADLVYVSNY